MSDEKLPDWMVATGIEDADMTGDYDPSKSIRRLWIKPGTGVKLIFLTDAVKSPVIWEHQVQLGGDWKNWFSCLKPLGIECDLCNWAEDNRGQFKRYKGAFFTVVDTSEYKDRSGKLHKNEKRLLCAKTKTVDLIKRRHIKLKEAGHALQYAMIEAYRSAGDKTPSVGDDFEFIKMIEKSAIADVEEFDYMELLKPDPEKVKNTVSRLMREKGKKSGDSGESSGGDWASGGTSGEGFKEGASGDGVAF